MNKYKKEEVRKYKAAREGKTESQIEIIDLEDSVQNKLDELARSLHMKMFPEEYDFMLDDGVDATSRKRGRNPMDSDYIAKVNERRLSLGVSELDASGSSVDNTRGICRELAEKTIYSSLDLVRPPAQTCVLCDKTVEEVGGYRLVSQKLRGVSLSDKPIRRGKYSHQAVKLYDDLNVYMLVWGEPEKWTDSAIEKAKDEYKTGHKPWFCQVCGERKCSTCGAPINRPMGSDVLYASGCCSHLAIHPIDPGCVNKECSRYKEAGNPPDNK